MPSQQLRTILRTKVTTQIERAARVGKEVQSEHSTRRRWSTIALTVFVWFGKTSAEYIPNYECSIPFLYSEQSTCHGIRQQKKRVRHTLTVGRDPFSAQIRATGRQRRDPRFPETPESDEVDRHGQQCGEVGVILEAHPHSVD